MKIFLAGVEKTQFLVLTELAQHPNALFSYFHWQKESDKEKALQRDILNRSNYEVICDSGLFTLMFGTGKNRTYDLAFMKEYTAKYIATAKKFGINNLTIVEADVHKILGMPAVFELRKYFEDSGMPVLYVWHREEGIDGLYRMAEKYDYIALSIPELRILFKGQKNRYQDVVKQLLRDIRKNVKNYPKIHLLGNTVQETMETTLAYSCDSTSWLSGGRWGRVIAFFNNYLKPISIHCETYKKILQANLAHFSAVEHRLIEEFGHKDTYLLYQKNNYFSARSYKLFQEYLDKQFPWIGLGGAFYNEKQDKFNRGRRSQDFSERLESQPPV